jgi:hypothetical protein
MLSVVEYEDLRSDSTSFVVKPGHEIGEVEAPIRRDGRYVVVRKHTMEAAVALETDPRS